jgi:hypothetical protein
MSKKNSVQQISMSQFIYTLGPGAIIESVNGPRLIPTLRNGLQGDFAKYVNTYEIKDVRMADLIRKKDDPEVRFFRLPTNSSEGKKDNQGIYSTIKFPNWHICYNEKEHEMGILYNTSNDKGCCPICGNEKTNPVRFISACPDGHMDEVSWSYAVHDNNDCTNYKYYYWDVDGSSLANIHIQCPKCKIKKSMQDVYTKSYKCSGRFPEKEQIKGFEVCTSIPKKNQNCKNKMKIIQRQSTSLRLAKTITLLKLPGNTNVLRNAFLNTTIKNMTKGAIKKGMLEDQYRSLIDVMIIGSDDNYSKKDAQNIINYINSTSYDTFIQKATDVYTKELKLKSYSYK